LILGKKLNKLIALSDDITKTTYEIVQLSWHMSPDTVFICLYANFL